MLEPWDERPTLIPWYRRWRRRASPRRTTRSSVGSLRPSRSHVSNAEPYIIATRRHGLRELHIYWGYTTGFTTEEEATRVGGTGATVGPSSKLKGTWYVSHPENRVQHREKRTRKVQREADFCDRCGEQKSLTGVCGNCD